MLGFSLTRLMTYSAPTNKPFSGIDVAQGERVKGTAKRSDGKAELDYYWVDTIYSSLKCCHLCVVQVRISKKNQPCQLFVRIGEEVSNDPYCLFWLKEYHHSCLIRQIRLITNNQQSVHAHVVFVKCFLMNLYLHLRCKNKTTVNYYLIFWMRKCEEMSWTQYWIKALGRTGCLYVTDWTLG